MSDNATFHFAWVGSGETGFNEVIHAREDEKVFSLRISQTEGEFATAEIKVRRPDGGLLNPDRLQYAWISVTRGVTVTGLFFGRVVGLPRDPVDDVVTLEFVAQFPGWQDDLASFFGTLKVAPFWDVAFIADQDLHDAQQALEARSAFYHYSRTTGEITLSDVLTGGSSMTISNHFYDSLRMDVTDNPARRAVVTATVEWEQQVTGVSSSINNRIQREFPGNTVNTFSGRQLGQSWPQSGDGIGGQSGYDVIFSRITAYGDEQLPSSFPAKSAKYKTKISEAENNFATAVLGEAQTTRDAKVKRWWFDTALDVAYSYRQHRSETITFTVVNDVQALAYDADGGDINISLTAEDVVGLTLMRPALSSYFLSPRGQDSFKYLLARARAALAASARAVEISVELPFFDGIALTCDHVVTIEDDRLPGGSATGKVKSYSFEIDGDTGAAVATVTLGVSVGNGASYSAGGTAGDYCDENYVGADYQSETGETADADIPDIIFEPYTAQIPTDPPVINRLSNDDLIAELTITNGPDDQAAALLSNQYPQRDDAAAVIEENPTKIALTLRSLEPSDDVTHTITVVITHPWAAPQGIDLAA